MSDNSWLLRGVDPEARQKVEQEAARLGVSVADYLTDLVVRRAVLDQLPASSEAEQTHVRAEDAANFAPPPQSPEGFAVRQRLNTLERRLGSSVGSLEGAVHALDTSLFDVTTRVGDVEALAGDTAHALGQFQQETNGTVAGLAAHLAGVEHNLSAQAYAQDERCTGLDRRMDGVERSTSMLAGAHEALKHAVAADFTAFTNESADWLNASLTELRAAADTAAEQADAAAAHLVGDLRSLRASIEDRLAESAEETRGRMHEAFADVADRMGMLAARVTDNERFVARAAEQLRAQMTDVEDGALVALEETAQSLRTADAALREEQKTQLAQLKLLDIAVGNTIDGVAELRETVERRLGEAEKNTLGKLQQVNADWDERFDAVTVRVARGEQQTQHLQQRLDAELGRVEASAFGALEKLRRDVGSGDAEAAQRLDAALEAVRADLDEVRTRVINEAHLLREEQTGALARLTLLDTAITRLEGASISTNARFDQIESALHTGDPELEQRIAQLEYAAAHAESEQALAIVRGDVAALTDRLDTLYADTSLADRLTALQRGQDQVKAQSADAAEKAAARAHHVEVALADLRLEVLSSAEAAATVSALQERLAAFELQQANALEALRADIARFVADNDRRLEALEARPAEAEPAGLAAEFETLRSRIEERVLGVELRSVRTLEQVVDTVATLEQRLINAGADEADAAKSA